MAQQPTWRGHRAPVENPDGPDVGTPAVARRRPRLLTVAGLAVAGFVVVGCAAVAARLVADEPDALPDITVGTCLTSTDLANGDLARQAVSLHELDAAPCDRSHDAEVFALRGLRAGEDLDSVSDRCLRAAADLGVDAAALMARDLEVRPLALTTSPEPGDTVACFIRHQLGTPLRGAVFTTQE